MRKFLITFRRDKNKQQHTEITANNEQEAETKFTECWVEYLKTQKKIKEEKLTIINTEPIKQGLFSKKQPEYKIKF
jgi:type II secretory pathway component PulF